MIRCTSEDDLFPKTIYFDIYSDMLYKGAIAKKGYNNFVKAGLRENAIVVTVPFIKKKIPLFILFRALGIESDKEILEYILYDINNPYKKELLNFLRHSINDASFLYSQDDAIEYLKEYVQFKADSKVREILVDDVFPNVGHNFKKKALFLGHLVNKIVYTALGIKPVTDRYSYIHKRVDVSGFLLSNLFRDFYNKLRNNIKSRTDSEYEYGSFKTTKKIETLIYKENLKKIFDYDIIETGFLKSMKGNWGLTGDPLKAGISQDLNRISYISAISHLRTVNTPMDRSTKIVEPHKLHSSQWLSLIHI